jgi:hypothetical protein
MYRHKRYKRVARAACVTPSKCRAQWKLRPLLANTLSAVAVKAGDNRSE